MKICKNQHTPNISLSWALFPLSASCHVVPPWPVFCMHSCVDLVTLLLCYPLLWQLLVSSAVISRSRNAWRFWRRRQFFTIIIFFVITSVVIITIKLCWSLLHIIFILTFRFGEGFTIWLDLQVGFVNIPTVHRSFSYVDAWWLQVWMLNMLYVHQRSQN